jgi:hypothetical protein
MDLRVRTSRKRIAAAAVAVLAGGGVIGSATAASASAATLAVDQACYVITSSLPTITISGTGFQAGVPVVITSSGSRHSTQITQISTQATPSATGAISTTVAAPNPRLEKPGQRHEILTATQTEATGQKVVATTPFWLTQLGAEHGSTKQEPGLKALSEQTTWSFSGFPIGKTIYAHYLIKGKQVALQSFGKAPAPCGVLTVRRPLFPGTAQHRSYPLQIDTSRPLVKNTAPKITRLRATLALEF